MKIEVKYSGKIINLPSSVAKFMAEASREDLSVIIGIYACQDMLGAFDKYITKFSESIGVGAEKVQKSLDFWAKRGVISIEGEISSTHITSASSSVPTYSGDQIAKFVEKNEDIRSLFLACQAILGKDFGTHDFNNVIYLKDTFRFSNEYIMLLLAHCKDLDKASWAYIRKTAQNLYDEGIDTYIRLEAHFADRKNKNSLEYKIRELFGIGKRELSKTERDKIERWLELELDIELIRIAYDITIDKTGKLSLAYCAKIIENWLSCGIKTA
ncbi:MAG: DnaD domain protein, partial [Clostridia bacterium]|nr:DnaD domain protein [Clostridia bacterium]